MLDYNQVIEETPVTGDVPPSAGGLVTFQFKCDVNGATDLSNTFFAADVQVASVSANNNYVNANVVSNAAGTLANGIYIPDAYDFHAFPMLRCFQSITHIIDGQTVCNSQHPYADAILVEKFLTTHSKANLENFQALSLCKQIDNGMKEHNIFTFDVPAQDWESRPGGWIEYSYDWVKPGLFKQKYTSGDQTVSYPGAAQFYGTEANRGIDQISTRVHTLLFQPPFDLWRLRQPMHGGIHQIQLNLKASETTVKWGGYMTTSCVGLSRKAGLIYDMQRGEMDDGYAIASNALYGGSVGPTRMLSLFDEEGRVQFVNAAAGLKNGLSSSASTGHAMITRAIAAAKLVDKVAVDIKRLRLLRRVIRTSVPPQLSNVQYNFTEISMQHGTPSSGGIAQQFLLPSTTFGLVFYWRESTNTDFDQVGVHPVIEQCTNAAGGNILDGGPNTSYFGPITDDTNAFGNAVGTNNTDIDISSFYRVRNLDFDLHDFHFTYGGATYPMQRIQRITGNRGGDNVDNPYGWHRMMTLQNQLQGVYNSTMDDFPHTYGHGYGKGVLTRMDPHMMFFPVSRTGNSDNGILQVEWNGKTRRQQALSATQTSLTADETPSVQLVVCALYDAQLNMQYSSNELQQIVLTQFK